MLHCFPNFVPGILQYGDTPEIASLIAPRPLHLNFGELDRGSPIDEVRAGLKRIANQYASMHAEKKFTHYIEEGSGHILSEKMWKKTIAVFDKYLKS